MLWNTLANAVIAATRPVLATISAVTVCGSVHMAFKKMRSGTAMAIHCYPAMHRTTRMGCPENQGSTAHGCIS